MLHRFRDPSARLFSENGQRKAVTTDANGPPLRQELPTTGGTTAFFGQEVVPTVETASFLRQNGVAAGVVTLFLRQEIAALVAPTPLP